MKKLKKLSILQSAIIFFFLSIVLTGILYFIYNYNKIDKEVETKRTELITIKKQELKDIISLTVQHINNEAKRLSKADLLTINDIKTKIFVEVYDVSEDLLAVIDSCESVPTFYYRKKVKIRLSKGIVLEAYIYICNDKYRESFEYVIENGIW